MKRTGDSKDFFRNDRKHHDAEGVEGKERSDAVDPVVDESMNLIGAVHAISDITEGKGVEESLRASQTFLQTIIESEPECVKLIDSGGALVMMNRAGLDMIEADSFDEVKGKKISHLVSPEHRDAFEALTREVFQGKSGILDFEMTGLKGRRNWLSTRAVPLRNEKGGIVALLGITRDITGEKLAKDALRESEEQYRDLFETASDLIQIVGPDGRLAYVNRSWRETLGYREEEIAGLSIFSIIDPGCGEHCAKTFQRVITEGRVPKIETVFIAKDGRRIMVEGSATCKYQNGQPVSTRCIFRDVTGKKKLEDELLKAQKLESIGILAGGIAHDFNNLLMAISGNISMAKLHMSPGEEAYRLLDSAEKASYRAAALTAHLITFSKGGEAVKQPGSMKNVILDEARFSLGGMNVSCDFDIPDDLWPVEFDEGQMRRVIHNVIVNACEAMQGEGKIGISAANIAADGKGSLPLLEGKYLRVSFTDQGVGIPRENLSRIFDPYFTTKETGSQKGMGLGLAVCYSIVRNHGGLITAESGEDKGTTFHIHLPVSEETPGPGAVPGRSVDGRRKVLVVDDEEVVREVAGEILRNIGFDVEFAVDGGEAIALFTKARDAGEPFDVVIVDLVIPGGLGGKEVIRKLIEIDPATKAIVCSGYSNDPVMTEFRKYGFSGVLAKPFKITELQKMLSKVTEAS